MFAYLGDARNRLQQLKVHNQKMVERYPWLHAPKCLLKLASILCGRSHEANLRNELQQLVPRSLIYFLRVMGGQIKPKKSCRKKLAGIFSTFENVSFPKKCLHYNDNIF